MEKLSSLNTADAVNPNSPEHDELKYATSLNKSLEE